MEGARDPLQEMFSPGIFVIVVIRSTADANFIGRVKHQILVGEKDWAKYTVLSNNDVLNGTNYSYLFSGAHSSDQAVVVDENLNHKCWLEGNENGAKIAATLEAVVGGSPCP